MNGLAYIGKVTSIGLIPGADHIVRATVDCNKGGRWHGVVRKDEVKDGDIVEVYLPDAVLPATERFAFMEQKKYRVRQAKFKGCPSTCLILPMGEQMLTTSQTGIGMDISGIIGVTKYDKPIPASMSGQVAGNFPAFIPKTDEILYQKAGHLIEALRDKPFYITLKYDGCSGTAYRKGDHFGVCSRNLELKEEGGGVWWEVAKKHDLRNILCPAYADNLAIQFEVVGPSVQGNPAGLGERELRVFDIYDIEAGQYFDVDSLEAFCECNDLPMADIIESGPDFHYDEEAMSVIADAVQYDNGKPGEGIVVRPQSPRMVGSDRLSFKVINLNYKE